MAGLCAAFRRRRVEAAAVVAYDERRPVAVSVHVDRDSGCRGVGLCVARRLARGPVDQRLRKLGRRAADPSIRRSVAIPAAASGLSRSLSAMCRPPAARFGGWMSTSSVTQIADGLSHDGAGFAQRRGLVVRAASARRLGDRREAEGDPGQVLNRAVVQVGRNSAALLRRRVDRAFEQRFPLAVAALQPAWPPTTPTAPGSGSGRATPPTRGGASVRSRRSALSVTESSAGRSRTGPACCSGCGSACAPRAACPGHARSGSPGDRRR